MTLNLTAAKPTIAEARVAVQSLIRLVEELQEGAEGVRLLRLGEALRYLDDAADWLLKAEEAADE